MIRSKTGVAGLDEVLHGGFISGRLYLIDGNPGAGKTTLALQFLRAGLREGERCLYITLSESADELRAGARSHGWSLEGVEIVELIAEDSDLEGPGQLTMYQPSEVELTETTKKVLDAVAGFKPQRMVFDSLSELRLLAQSSLRYRRQVLALKQFFVGRGCTVLLLNDRAAESSDTQLQSIVHGVVSLEHRAPTYGPLLRQLQVVKFRGSDFLSGYQDFIIQRGGIEVFPRLKAAEHGASFVHEALLSGVAELDALFGGGIDRGTSTLLIGPPGTGKSTVALQFAQAAAQRGSHAAVFTFEESLELLLSRCEGLGIRIRDSVAAGTALVKRIDPAQVLPGQFAQMVRQAVECHDARVVVIDSLSGYMNAMPEARALTVQLHELLSYLNNHGVVTFVVAAQTGLMGANMRSPVDASYMADAVVVFRMYEHLGQVKKAVSVLKKRSGRHEESVRQMWFDEQGIHLSPPLLHLRGVLTGVPEEVGRHGAPAVPSRAVDVGHG